MLMSAILSAICIYFQYIEFEKKGFIGGFFVKIIFLVLNLFLIGKIKTLALFVWLVYIVKILILCFIEYVMYNRTRNMMSWIISCFIIELIIEIVLRFI